MQVLGSRNQTGMAQHWLLLKWAPRHAELAGVRLGSLGLCIDRSQAKITMAQEPVILYNLCLCLVDDDLFKEPMKKRRRSDRDQRFRAFPSVEQSALKECECRGIAIQLFEHGSVLFQMCENAQRKRRVNSEAGWNIFKWAWSRKGCLIVSAEIDNLTIYLQESLERRVVKITSSGLEQRLWKWLVWCFSGYIYTMPLHFSPFFFF